MDTPQTLIGNADTYTVNGALGRHGKFGGVLTATDSHGNAVSIKALARHSDALLCTLSRLQTLDRPDIARITDSFIAPDGRLCIVRQLVPGTDLKSIFANKKLYGHIDEDSYIRMGCAVLRALAAVHGVGVVHRDIKPSNIVLRHDADADITKADFSQITLIDFEQAMSLPYDGTARTQFALIYSPPEMLLKHNELVTPTADLFALAISIYHLVMGKTPYTDCNPEVLINLQLTYPMKKPGRMTDQLFDVLARAAYKQPFRLPPRRLSPAEIVDTLRQGVEGRYQTADDMLHDLLQVAHALKPANWFQRTFGA